MTWWQRFLPHPALWAALLAMAMAQVLKPFFHRARGYPWEWHLFFEDGYMPSTHAAMVTAAAHAIGLTEGFHTPIFALAVVVAIIVAYDSANVRWQTGIHARWLNRLLVEFMRQEITPQQLLDEVVGHTPWEVFWGILVGLVAAHGVVYFWPR